MRQHLLVDVLEGFLLGSLAPGLHPRDQTQHRPSDERGDARQVEGQVVVVQPIPEEACQTEEGGQR